MPDHGARCSILNILAQLHLTYPVLAAIIGEGPMTNCNATEGKLEGHGSAREEALKRRNGAVREALGMGSKPKPDTEGPAEQTANDKSGEPAAP